MNTLQSVITLKMTVRDALKILIICGRSNGLGDNFYTSLYVEVAKHGNIEKAMQERTFGSIDYYKCQSDIEKAFLSEEKSESEKELEILQQKMDDLQQQMNVVKQKMEKRDASK